MTSPIGGNQPIGQNPHVYERNMQNVGGQTQAVPPELEKTALPLELGFLDGSTDPALICGSLLKGFRVVGLDGKPLPSQRSK